MTGTEFEIVTPAATEILGPEVDRLDGVRRMGLAQPMDRCRRD